MTDTASPDPARRTGGTRRALLRATGAAGLGALVHPFARAQGTQPETRAAKLGFIALTDAAPLFVADEKGFFKKHGMTDVEVAKQSSWGTTRDNLVLGSKGGGIDGAHLLTPMAYLITTGAVTANNVPVPIQIVARLNLGGQCISVANEYKELKVGLDNKAFGRALLAKRVKTGKPVNAAMTFPGGTHDLWIRYWMAAGGVDPNRDITTIVVPPPQMVANMKVGSMDTFCVCEPWNKQLITQSIGYTALTTSELWANHPEKALALRADWIAANPNATRALLKAVMEAQMWCEEPANRAEVAEICARRRWINAPIGDIVDRVKGDFDYGTGRVESNSRFQMRYWKDFASYPFQSHDLWFLTENIRWGYLPANTDTKALVAKVNREDLWRAAAKELGVAAKDIPAGTSRGVERFFDGKVFDPADPKKYLDSLAIKAIKTAA
jgi:nitrate/nitrite transport system substrate-binding protein